MYVTFESNFDRISIRLMSTKNIFENKSGLVKNLENHEVLMCLERKNVYYQLSTRTSSKKFAF